MRSSLIGFIIVLLWFISQTGLSQKEETKRDRILFRGMVIDASTYTPVPNTQILINNIFSSLCGEDGTFSFFAYKKDTIIFSNLGYKSKQLFVSDTLNEIEFITGIYLTRDTMSIGEVVIIPRHINLKSEILNARSNMPETFNNARYNVAVSAYQGRNGISNLGTPDDNYAVLIQKQKIDAYERGGIPSDNIVGLSPFMLISAAYLLINGLPEKNAPLKPKLSEQDVVQIHEKYLEILKQKK
jgi:hypothetical protein